uniref:DNA/RNA helicase protein n=1 Tax=Cupressus sempervirens TaxID=13469 RepID=A0A3S6N0G4_CUPSE|nr:DNA/RNA helicase protein [Cupressus sempervirens]
MFRFDEEEGDEEEENILNSQSSDNNYMVGFVTANIVGLQYYRGSVNGREMVGLIREPENPYDPNAIKVLNMRGLQVGHIERSVAAALAPLVDQGLILIEAIVPNGRGLNNAYKMPCQIYVFSQRELMGVTLEVLTENGLNVITTADQEFMTTQSVAAKEKIQEEPQKKSRDLDEIFGAAVDVGAKKRQAMEPGSIVVAKLLQHQKEALAWMVQRENSLKLPPFWEAYTNQGKKVYKNILTNFESFERPDPLRGGILADDMGLGKTLALLSLIATNRPGAELPPIVDMEPCSGSPNPENSTSVNPHSENPNFGNPCVKNSSLQNLHPENPKFDYHEAGSSQSGTRNSRVLKNPKPCPESSKPRERKRKRDGSRKKTDTHASRELTSSSRDLEECGFDPPDPHGPKTTLVVCPPSVISNWVTQLEEHTNPGKLKVHLYHGDQRNREGKELRKFDIVLTTYSTLGSEFFCPGSPMKEVDWLRVILDEAHFIKNANTKQAKAAVALKAQRRWAVTGTPIQNTSFDLFTLMTFLQFQPFSIKSYWNSLVQRPLSQGNASGRARLQALMETIALRRTKDMKINGQRLVELPPKFVEIHLVELCDEERQLYDRLEAEGKKVVQHFIKSGTVLNNYSTVLQILLRLRQLCDDPALCPSDIELLISSLKLEDASSNPDLLKKLLLILQDGDDFDCPVCLSPPTEAIITICSHVFCKRCIEKTLRHDKPRCPMCRKELTETDLFCSPKASQDDVKLNKSAKSSKVKALISFLKESRNNDPTKKSVIFSQFRKMLDLLQEPLEREGFKFVRLDGSMPSKKRASTITAFASTNLTSPTILLASLKAAGVGINLTAASDVYMFDPWWNPAAEDQAMDRVHRIGQTRSVRVCRLVVKDSVEESILEMQERKRKLASSAFNKSEKEQRQMRVEDVQHLMRL